MNIAKPSPPSPNIEQYMPIINLVLTLPLILKWISIIIHQLSAKPSLASINSTHHHQLSAKPSPASINSTHHHQLSSKASHNIE